jgi:hypothetical protein
MTMAKYIQVTEVISPNLEVHMIQIKYIIELLEEE